MSVTSTNPLSTPRLRGWAAVLVVIVIVCGPVAQIQDVLTNLIALSAVLVCGSAVSSVSTRRPQLTA
ncbi:hypothetical protein [Streptomyces griseomycini]|uniref:Uncharacterized protein n=1 Tax=Streptomyces griseomycini TaxID=66895 RepID=A0A7W7M182_9ACTN|nr:hypothetical protein [Streptomyces griseomycini]MBB4900204.1 hypothetical protein [Streptomyces griseomycini]GGQ12029.1 hypothetical protein GCM10010266_39130 [Streptomyces griseomycini]GGR26120.1 hypothetical protein GCM10015536_34750 [Streptomyces griseomycini]